MESFGGAQRKASKEEAMKGEEGGEPSTVEQAVAKGSAVGEGGGGGKKGGGRGGEGLKKGPWTPAEDAILVEHVRRHGEGNWNAVQRHSGLARCGKSCRLRWANHLRPNLKKGSFSPEEELLILRLHAQLGNKWARMAAQLPGRTDNEIKNYWNTRLKRRQRAGLPIYPPEMHDAARLDGHHHHDPQRQVNTTSPVTLRQLAAELPSLQLPPLVDPIAFRPLSGITLSPFPQNPFASQLGLGFPPSPASHPPTPTSLFQQLGLGNYAMNQPPPLSPAFAVKMELPSCQLFAEPVSYSDEPSSCGLLEALLQDTQTIEDMKIAELLELQEANEEGTRWEQLFCDPGNDGEGIKETSQGCSSAKFEGFDWCMGTTIKSEQPGDASLAKDDTATLLDIPTSTLSMIPDWCNSDGRDISNGQSLVTTSDEIGLDIHQLASSLSVGSTEQDWNISLWPWNNMPGIC
ncbi:hypothetical protein C4D60_Mb02t14740 [Musa balbisiana]|uniref:Transcription factor GAMYB n=1 Tax=Musa balbisiana TaxID=52838 RepID=A0A4S8IAW7_MUSBA|nr:hypothetical protein C4D60_Mb02t14740 [Musa balbisiana]